MKNLSSTILALLFATLARSEAIVEVYDLLENYMLDPKTNLSVKVNVSEEIYSFPWNTNYEKNLSVPGYFCAVGSYKDFVNQCESKVNATDQQQWVVMAPFANDVAQEFLDRMKNGSIKHGNGLIMVSDDMVVSESLFVVPQIISQVTYADSNVLYYQSINYNPNFTANLSHTFIERCYILDPVTPTYLVLAGLWLLAGVVWYALTYHFFKSHAIFLQRVLMMIPVCKGLETMINGFFYNACPWSGSLHPGEKYLEMARISIITIVYTVLLALLYIVSKGWQTLLFQMTRNQATSLTMIMGAVYLTFSAYFLSSDFSGISSFMRLLMTGLFLGLGVANISHLRTCLTILRTMRIQNIRDDPQQNIMGPALDLKITLLQQFVILQGLYFTLKVINYGIIMFMQNPALTVRYGAVMQTLEFCLLCGILFVFRPRRLPAFYSVGMGEMLNFRQNQFEGQERPRVLAPLLETVITKRLFQDEYKRGVFVDESVNVGERQAVVILNPTKYTIREEDLPSANDDQMEIHSSLNDSNGAKNDLQSPLLTPSPSAAANIMDPLELMQNLKLGYKEKRRGRGNESSDED